MRARLLVTLAGVLFLSAFVAGCSGCSGGGTGSSQGGMCHGTVFKF